MTVAGTLITTVLCHNEALDLPSIISNRQIPSWSFVGVGGPPAESSFLAGMNLIYVERISCRRSSHVELTRTIGGGYRVADRSLALPKASPGFGGTLAGVPSHGTGFYFSLVDVLPPLSWNRAVRPVLMWRLPSRKHNRRESIHFPG